MNASDLPWWVWMLGAIIFWAIGVFLEWIYEGESYRQDPSARALVLLKTACYGLWTVSAFGGLVGIVRLVKWAWK